MKNFTFGPTLQQWHLRSVTKCLLLAGLLTLCGTFLFAQTPVVLAPAPKLQFFTESGAPLSFGCIFSYQSGTTTPLPTYTDFTGVVQNSNPVILDGGGFAGPGGSGIWISAGQAYRLSVVSAGGTNCALGSLLYTVDGIGGGVSTLTSLITYSATPVFPIQAQNQLFEITLTGNAVAQPLTAVGITAPAWVAFQITQDGVGGHSFNWPANLIGGAPIGLGANQVTTQFFYWNGSSAIALGPGVTGTGPALSAGSLAATGSVAGSQLTSTVAIGQPPIIVTSSTLVPNLNVGFLEGGTWQSPGSIGSTAPSSGAFTHLVANTDFTLNGSTAQTGVQGSDAHLMSAGTVAGTGVPLCTDANHGATTSGCASILAVATTTLSGTVGPFSATPTTILSQAVTFPSTGCPCRALVSYSFVAVQPSQGISTSWVSDGTNSFAAFDIGINAANLSQTGMAAFDISPVTYANSAAVTFTLTAESSTGTTAQGHNFGPSPAYLRILVIPSN
jgi:hypothetical protein